MQIQNNLRYWLTAANFQSRQLELMTYTLLVIAFPPNYHHLRHYHFSVDHSMYCELLNFHHFDVDTMVRRVPMQVIRVNVYLAHILASIDLKLILFDANLIPSECWYVSIQSARTDY